MSRTACQHQGVQQNAGMTDNALIGRFTVKQKITMPVNRHEIRPVDANGVEGH